MLNLFLSESLLVFEDVCMVWEISLYLLTVHCTDDYVGKLELYTNANVGLHGREPFGGGRGALAICSVAPLRIAFNPSRIIAFSFPANYK